MKISFVTPYNYFALPSGDPEKQCIVNTRLDIYVSSIGAFGSKLENWLWRRVLRFLASYDTKSFSFSTASGRWLDPFCCP